MSHSQLSSAQLSSTEGLSFRWQMKKNGDTSFRNIVTNNDRGLIFYNLAQLFRSLQRLTGVDAFGDISNTIYDVNRTTREVERAKNSAQRVASDARHLKDKVTDSDDRVLEF
jgi:hypothetical protein